MLFSPLGGVPVKASVPTKKVRNQDLPTTKRAVLVSGQTPIPVVPAVNDQHTKLGHSKGVKGPSKPNKQSKKEGRFTLAWYKLYLDSCATYHTSFVTSLLQDVKEVGTTLHGNCNAGVTATKTKG